MAKTTIHIEDATWVRVRQLALAEGITVRELINNVLRALVTKKPVRAAAMR